MEHPVYLCVLLRFRTNNHQIRHSVLQQRLEKNLFVLNKLWMKFGLILGKFMNPIIMGILFFLVLVPTGLIIKILRKDILNKNINKKKNSYWIIKNNVKSEKTDLKNQF